MKNLNSKLQKATIGLGLISSMILSAQEIESKKILTLNREDFTEEKVLFRGKEITNFNPVFYDLDTGKKIILDQKVEEKMPKDASWADYFEYLKKKGYDLCFNIYCIQAVSAKKDSNDDLIMLKEDYLKFDKKGDLIIPPILEKIKIITKDEFLENRKIKDDGRDYLNRVYIMKTKEDNLFIFRYLNISFEKREINLEIYKIKEDHQ
jgi:hypothetical protein